MGLAFDYVHANGLETENDYPYKARDQSCKFESNKVDGDSSVKSHAWIKPKDPNALLQAVTVGPVSVAIEADTFVF